MDWKEVYFIGIGGIGMSAIARYYHRKGLKVSGYDKTPSALTKELEQEGISVHYTDNSLYVPADREHTLVVYTPAIPHDMGELMYVNAQGYTVIKRSAILGEITRGQQCLAVAGTHGKTSTSTLAAHIFTDCEEGCSAFLGGISKNYGTNLLVSKNPVVVVEADEFDRSFLQLRPSIAVITAMDADHLDIYGTLESYQKAFREFAALISNILIKKEGLPISPEDTKARIFTYSLESGSADFHPENVHIDETGHYIFDLVWPGGIIRDVKVGTPGRFNAENSIAAAALCLSYGLKPEKVKAGIGTFKGVSRRMDIHVNKPGLAYIDDYAHHPEELASAIRSIRDIFPGRKVTAIFQPHLYTRTRDFADDFARALSAVDKLILLDIYPAREEPIPGVTSALIFDKVTAPEKVLIKKEELMQVLENEKLDVLVTFGAGNVDRYIGPITQMLEDRK
ncbi:MAG: UDP-N-acetylmuramate--L-alanine ligase [Bacteroidales bacterium]|nr:UDP-N-acetylmuramate--L-alanine ligase [Bacteroidales bacterium]